MSELLISVTDSDDDASEVHDLFAAIVDDEELTSARKSLVPRPPQPGVMGAEEWVRLVLDNPGLDMALSTCVTAWLAMRRKRRLRIVVQANGTAEIEVNGIKNITAAEVMDVLDAARRGAGDEASRS